MTVTNTRQPAGQADLIDQLGGPTFVARVIAAAHEQTLKKNTVSTWKHRGIPHRYRHTIAQLAARNDVALPDGFIGRPLPANLDELQGA